MPRRDDNEQDRIELGRRAAAHIRTENQPWNAKAKVTDLAKQTKKIAESREK